MKQTKFEIGDWVQCNSYRVRRRNYANNAIKWEKKVPETPFIAQVTGAGYRFNGRVLKGYEDEGPYFDPQECFFVYKIKRGLTNKEIIVKENDIEHAIVSLWTTLPFKYVNYPEHYRKILSEESKSYPRDAKGRFCK